MLDWPFRTLNTQKDVYDTLLFTQLGRAYTESLLTYRSRTTLSRLHHTRLLYRLLRLVFVFPYHCNHSQRLYLLRLMLSNLPTILCTLFEKILAWRAVCKMYIDSQNECVFIVIFWWSLHVLNVKRIVNIPKAIYINIQYEVVRSFKFI